MDHHDAELLKEYKDKYKIVMVSRKMTPILENREQKKMMLRKMGHKIWYRYAILPNVEGQKYFLRLLIGVDQFIVDQLRLATNMQCRPIYCADQSSVDKTRLATSWFCDMLFVDQ
ncbi:hypothetical protein Fcan01_21999 [Folsomia candida]|uniref:Uncharacterized protein n=1 Tax=Folsomia candida TaxID=158441 RepID=A0A226DC18_FOLCA|nr:hypothetical protein Fcan01_21999 [Folsomia candida]